jgi:hypothetical protein
VSSTGLIALAHHRKLAGLCTILQLAGLHMSPGEGAEFRTADRRLIEQGEQQGIALSMSAGLHPLRREQSMHAGLWQDALSQFLLRLFELDGRAHIDQ